MAKKRKPSKTQSSSSKFPKSRLSSIRPTPKDLLIEEENVERLQLQEIQELETIKKEIENEKSSHPLTKITRSDITRSTIGALIGTVGHFAFFYGVEIADRVSVNRATTLYVLSLVVAFFFMYYSGFRKVKEIKIFRFIPLRVATIFLISTGVIVVTLFVFGFIDFTTPLPQIYRLIATNELLAVLGASTADILGKEK